VGHNNRKANPTKSDAHSSIECLHRPEDRLKIQVMSYPTDYWKISKE